MKITGEQPKNKIEHEGHEGDEGRAWSRGLHDRTRLFVLARERLFRKQRLLRVLRLQILFFRFLRDSLVKSGPTSTPIWQDS